MSANYTKIKLLLVVFIFAAVNACKDKSPEKPLKPLNADLIKVTDSISVLMNTFHYNPKELTTDKYLQLEKEVKNLAETAQTKEEFIREYNLLWQNGPFSHVRLDKMNQPAQEIAKYIDTLRVGDQSVSLEWMENTAILTVNTMMGVDTKERVEDAYKEIDKRDIEYLIVDLRNNDGGTFAGIPLIAHLISDPLEIGVFVSQKWWNSNSNPPIKENTLGLTPWQGWSIQTFWNDAQENPLTRLQIQPMSPRFDGQVYVLISDNAFSAAELTSDGLANIENVLLIGETTGGEVLSQKMYDLPMDMQLSIPIADYYSFRIGRIEGQGVSPDIEIDPRVAKDLAISLTNGVNLEDAVTKAKDDLKNMSKN